MVIPMIVKASNCTFLTGGIRGMVSMGYGNIRVCVHPLIAVPEMIIIMYILSVLPSLAVNGFNYVNYAMISSLILAGSLGSLFLHEYAHLLAARIMRLPVEKMTISLFGAHTSFDGEPSTAKSLFVISAAGPLMNSLIGIIFYVAHLLLIESAVVSTIFLCLSVFNGVLSAYNLLPVMPLDGGCIVRSVLWSKGKNVPRSNQLSFTIGNAFIFICFLTGIVGIFSFRPVISIICFVLGVSLWKSSTLAYQQMMTARFFSSVCLKSR
jgi:Zn-dependent protease